MFVFACLTLGICAKDAAILVAGRMNACPINWLIGGTFKQRMNNRIFV